VTLFGFLAILLFSTPYAGIACCHVNLSFITFSWFTNKTKCNFSDGQYFTKLTILIIVYKLYYYLSGCIYLQYRSYLLCMVSPRGPHPTGLRVLGVDPRTGTYIATGPLSDRTLICGYLVVMISVQHTSQ